MAIKAVFLDLDETLLDNETSALEAWKLFRMKAGEAGFQFDWQILETKFQTVAYEHWVLMENQPLGMTPLEFRVKVFRETLGLLGSPEKEASLLGNIYNGCQIETYRFFPDLRPALDLLKEKYLLGLITNGWLEYQKEKLRALGLEDHFQTVVVSTEVGWSKPDPRIFQSACQRLSIEPSEAVMAGDNPKLDGEGALGAGLHSVWLNRTGRSPASPLPEGLGIIPRFQELPRWIEESQRGGLPPRWRMSP